jgi:hypothetical protein
MTAIGVNAKLVQRGMPMLVRGPIMGRVYTFDWASGAVVLGVADRFILFLMFGIWCVEVFAFLEKWPSLNVSIGYHI